MTSEDPHPEVYNFPCPIPLKVMGRDENDFEGFVLGTLRRLVPKLNPGDIQRRPSRAGNYVSLTITLIAENRQHLDAIYAELHDHERILMVL